jgi:hypothetical protein
MPVVGGGSVFPPPHVVGAGIGSMVASPHALERDWEKHVPAKAGIARATRNLASDRESGAGH